MQIAKSERLTVLSEAEQEALYGIQDFDDAQRLEYACPTPGISKMDFSIAVFGENVIEKEVGGAMVDGKVFLRPIVPSRYYRIVSVAFFEGWISLSQARFYVLDLPCLGFHIVSERGHYSCALFRPVA